MERKLKNALLFVAVAWPVMMLGAYLMSLVGAFAGTNLLAFGLIGLPTLFVARLISLQFIDRPGT